MIDIKVVVGGKGFVGQLGGVYGFAEDVEGDVMDDQYGGVHNGVLENVFPHFQQAQYGVILGDMVVGSFVIFRFQPAIGCDVGQYGLL